MQFPLLMLWRYKRQCTDKTLTLRKMYEYESARSERASKFSHFHILKLLFPSIFCWYFRYFVSETHSLSVILLSNYQLSLSYHLWYDAIYKRHYTDKTLTMRKCMYVRASLENFGIFTF